MKVDYKVRKKILGVMVRVRLRVRGFDMGFWWVG